MEPKPTQPYLKPIYTQPSMEMLGHQLSNGVCKATDNCIVEPDGWCEHGYVSWLLYLGFM